MSPVCGFCMERGKAEFEYGRAFGVGIAGCTGERERVDGGNRKALSTDADLLADRLVVVVKPL